MFDFHQLPTRALNYAMNLSACTELLLISLYWVKIFQFFLCVFIWNQSSTTQGFKQRYLFIHLTFTCTNQSLQRKHKNKAWNLRGVFKTLSNKVFAKIPRLSAASYCLYCLNFFIKMWIQNLIENLRWTFFRK